jgi:hypothetical protein
MRTHQPIRFEKQDVDNTRCGEAGNPPCARCPDGKVTSAVTVEVAEVTNT